MSIQAAQAGDSASATATPVSRSFAVSGSPNFSIIVPKTLTAPRGVVVAYTLQLKALNGFTGNVTGAVRELPLVPSARNCRERSI